MADQTFTYSTFNKICCGALPADIIICVPANLTASGYSTLEASLTEERCFKSGCSVQYNYTISVDEDLLAPEVTLTGANVQGILCDDCLIQFIRDAIAQAIGPT